MVVSQDGGCCNRWVVVQAAGKHHQLSRVRKKGIKGAHLAALDAIRNYYTPGGLNSSNLFSQRSGGWKTQDEASSGVWFLIRAVFLACGQPPSCSVLTWPFLNAWVLEGAGREGGLLCVSSYKDTNPLGSWPSPDDLI